MEEQPKEPIIKRLEKLEDLTTKKKKINLGKAKVKGSKLKKNWIGVLKVDENMVGNLTKVQLDGNSFDFNHETYHAIDGSEVILINGKYPLIVQPTWRKNPLQIRKDGEVNETYGQEYIKAKLLKDVIKVKKPAGSGLIIILVGAVVLFVVGKYVLKLF